MKLQLESLKLSLAEFTLDLSVCLTAQTTGIFGASGAGKTSLLETIAGLRRPSAGRIVFEGEVFSDASRRVFVRPERRGVGYVPQDMALFPHLNVRENLAYARKFGRPAPVTKPDSVYEQVMDTLSLAGLMDRQIGQLSGGEQRRVAWGRALLAGPRLLLLDEPFAGLDGSLRRELLKELTVIRDQFSLPMLLVSHQPDDLVALCTESLFLEHGLCRQHGQTLKLFKQSTQPTYELVS